MAVAYKVQNMPPIDDNIIHRAVSEEDEEAEEEEEEAAAEAVDLHSVAEVDHSVEVYSVIHKKENLFQIFFRPRWFRWRFRWRLRSRFWPTIRRLRTTTNGWTSTIWSTTTRFWRSYDARYGKIFIIFSLHLSSFDLGRGRPPFRGGYGYDGDFAGIFLKDYLKGV
jgi:hypothetical protein